MFIYINVLVLIRSGICSESLTCPSALTMLWFASKTSLMGYELDSFQMTTKPKDVLKECTSYIPDADLWTVNGIRLTPHQNKTPNVYVVVVVLLNSQHQLFHSAAIINQTLNCHHKTFIVPVFFPFHIFCTFLHLDLEPCCLNSCQSISESIRGSLFVDNGPQWAG